MNIDMSTLTDKTVAWYEQGPEVSSFSPPSNWGFPVIQGSKVLPFPASQYHIWSHKNIANDEMENGYNWVSSTIQTECKIQVAQVLRDN